MKPADSFEVVRDLPGPDQRRLLHDGDPAERLWAAWALTLRLGRDVVPLLEGADIASPGLRAHMVVLLAGLGERDALRTIAAADPNEHVRACAVASLIRIAPSPHDPSTVALAYAALGADVAAVREAVLAECEAGRVDLGDNDVAARLADSSPEVQLAAARCVAERSALTPRLLQALLGFVLNRREASRWNSISRSGQTRVLTALAWTWHDVGPTLAMFAAARIRLDWPALAALAEARGTEVLGAVLRVLPKQPSREAIAWVAERCAILAAREHLDEGEEHALFEGTQFFHWHVHR